MVEGHGQLLRRVAHATLRRCGLRPRSAEVEDVVQEAWCRLFEHFGPVPAFPACDLGLRRYLVRTTRNLALDEVRRRRTAKRGAGWRRCGEADPGFEERLVDRTADPEADLLRRDRRRSFLRRCAPFLGRHSPRRDLAILEMALLDGLSSRQVARRLGGGLTSGAVDMVVHRLRRGLSDQGIELPSRH